jgi:hypothetical protein
LVGIGVSVGVGVGSISCGIGVVVGGSGVAVGSGIVAVGVGVGEAGLVEVGHAWLAAWTIGATVATGGGVGVFVGVGVGLGLPPHPVSGRLSNVMTISTTGSTSLMSRARYTFMDSLLRGIARAYPKLAVLSSCGRSCLFLGT